MKMTPVFSIVVPVYKVEDYLDRCVKSLREQTLDDIEIILVDDGSPDHCGAMCDAWAEKDSRIVVIHKENEGPSAARNAGSAQAQGRYIMFVDSDDYIDLDACERLLPFADGENDVIIGDGICEKAEKKLCHGYTSAPVTGREYLKLALEGGSMPMVVWLYAYRRQFLVEGQLGFRQGIIHEDEQFIPRVFLAAQRVIESGVRFYHYELREDSITTRKDLRQNMEDMCGVCQELSAVYKNLEDPVLRRLLLDSLVVKYLSLFQQGQMYRYGRTYIRKRFVLHNAKRPKTVCKALLFALSPRLYWNLNNMSKQGKMCIDEHQAGKE